MTKTTRVREVYAELRSGLGNEVPAREILRLAHWIVDAADQRVILDYTGAGSRPQADAVDQMMMRNPWLLVEDARENGFFEDDEPVGPIRGQRLHEIMRMAA